MIFLTRLQQDSRAEMYQIENDEHAFGQLFIYFSHDYLFLDGYLYLNVSQDISEEEADELADDIIVRYLNHHCPMDYGQDYTSFEVYIIRDGDSYLVELEDDDFYDDVEDEDEISDRRDL